MHVDRTGSAVSALLDDLGIIEEQQLIRLKDPDEQDTLLELTSLLKKFPQKDFRAAMGLWWNDTIWSSHYDILTNDIFTI